MEFWIWVWLGVGFITAIVGAIIDKDMFMFETDFKKEFSAGFFAFFVIAGPLFALYMLFASLGGMREAAEEKRQMEAEKEKQRQRNEKAKLARQRAKEERKAKLATKVEALSEKLEILSSETSQLDQDFFTETATLAEFFLQGNKSDLTKQQRTDLIHLVRQARIKIMSNLTESKATTKLTERLSTTLEKTQAKFG